MEDLVAGGVAVGATIIGVVQIIRMTGWLSDRYAGLVAVVLGLALSAGLAVAPGATEVVIKGLGLGVLASVGYAGAKKTLTNMPNPPEEIR